jgi:hypothetical protein
MKKKSQVDGTFECYSFRFDNVATMDSPLSLFIKKGSGFEINVFLDIYFNLFHFRVFFSIFGRPLRQPIRPASQPPLVRRCLPEPWPLLARLTITLVAVKPVDGPISTRSTWRSIHFFYFKKCATECARETSRRVIRHAVCCPSATCPNRLAKSIKSPKADNKIMTLADGFLRPKFHFFFTLPG